MGQPCYNYVTTPIYGILIQTTQVSEDFFTMGAKFVLKDTLDYLDMTPHQFSLAAEVRKNTIYDMIKNETKRIEVKNLNSIVNTLNKIAENKGITKNFDINDVMIWEKE